LNLRTTLYLVILLIFITIIIGVRRWQSTQHRSADQEILIQKAHHH